MPSEFAAMEKKWQDFWEKEGIYAFNRSSKLPVFSIDTPPPTVSGRMHLGHAFSYTQADMVARFKRMQGFNVFYPFGFDDNGLATERMVEKNLNIQGKNFPRQKFIEMCLEETRKTEQLLESDFRAIAISVDWGTLYRTISKEAQKTAQLSFIEIYEMKRAYRKEAPTMWCPKCETAIAQAELEDEQKPSNLVFIVFEVEGIGNKITIATTRPEMLPACVAVHVHPKDKRYASLVGKKAIVPFSNRQVPIIANEEVKIEFGSGAVYNCTYGGQQDVEWSLAFNLAPVEIIDKKGKLNEKAGEFAGLNVNDARKQIVEKLQTINRVEKIEPIEHTVNVHERCKTPIEILTSRQWFVKYLDLKKDFLKKGREINWVPLHMRSRMENWIDGLKWDWNISRQRFYGVPFPVWYCKKCGRETIAGKKALPVDPTQDLPHKKCVCGSGYFEGEKDVFDTWFTSSLTPQIALNWANYEKGFSKKMPMDLRVQAHDIINLWAFYTIVKAFLHGKKTPWKNIMISGHALDARGRKMSKSLGNVIEPIKVINDFSADILRYWAASATLGDDLSFQDKDMISGKKFMQKLLNVSKFVKKAGEQFDFPKADAKKMKFRAVDKWVVSRLNGTIMECTKSLESFEFSKALNCARGFFWLEFADYYLEEVKYRVYGSENEEKNSALFTLNHCMFGMLRLFAPFFPHIAEEIAQESFGANLSDKSIHLEKWPGPAKGFDDKKAVEAGESLKEIIAAVRKEKTARQLSMNREMKKISVFGPKGLESVLPEIKNTMNAKEVFLGAGKGEIQLSKGISISMEF